MEMILKDVMKGKVKIGTIDGSGFVFCGVVDRETDKQLDYVAELSEGHLKTDIENAEQRKKKLEEYIRTIDEQQKKEAEKEYKKCCTALMKKKKNLEEFKPLQDREVLDIYDSFLEDCKIIIIKGSEYGKWWTCAEYERRKI